VAPQAGERGVDVALACRIVLCMRVERAFGLEPHPYWLLPIRDLLSFA
jgi:ceramide glucosyltransferase